MKKIGLFIMLFLLSLGAMAQIDTEFWFAAPDLDVNHAQEPVRFCVVSYDDAATVVFEQPANPDYEAQTFHLNANDFYVYDVSDIVYLVETQPYNTVLNYGFHIFSDTPVSIYYESDNNNSEIYSLKGRNALGTQFVVPMQYTFENYYSSTCSRIEVVASEDNTEVTFVPSVAIKGGGFPGVPVTVSLNRGQSYAIEAASPQGAAHLRNTRITASKPIAVNTSDDSVNLGGHYDLVGDQIVPVDLLGTDYIAIWNNNPDEYLYFFPTEDNTHIYLNGSSMPVATLDVGQEYTCQITSAVVYIHADRPISVFQLSSSSMNEFGGTVLPQISCTGSRKTVYKRQSTSNLVVTLIVRTPFTDGFVLNGNSTYITASDFTAVPANPDYSYCKKNVSNYVPTNGLMSLENTYAEGYFHLGILTGIEGDTWNYGYFSDYQPYAFAQFEMDDTYCSGQDIEFFYSSEYVSNLVLLLPDGNTVQLPYVLSNAQPDQAGTYALQGEDCNGVRILDEIDISINGASETIISLEGCYGFTWHGNTYTHSVDSTWMVPGSGDCDSIYTLHLTIWPPNDTTLVDASICVGQTYDFHGELYNHDGDIAYFDTIDNHGCLKVEKLVLSVGEYQMPPIQNEYVCYGYDETPYFKWDKNNTEYFADTYDEAIVPDPNGGCDFKYRLNLKFHQDFYLEEEPVVACDEYTWWANGETVTGEGEHNLLKNFKGGGGPLFDCDSVYIVRITINEQVILDDEYISESCDFAPVHWYNDQDTVFLENTVYKFTGLTDDGCYLEQTYHIENMQFTPAPLISFTEDDYYRDGDTIPVVTNTEFFSFQYDFFVEDSLGHFGDWDSCVWHISKESWLIEPDPAEYQSETDKRYCRVFVAEHDDIPTELSCTVYNSHCEPYSITRRFYLKSSFFGVDEQDAASFAFNAIPNPNNGNMELRFENMVGRANLKVYDMMGNLVDQFELENASASQTYSYNLKGRASGVYFFVATGKEGTVAQKVVVER